MAEVVENGVTDVSDGNGSEESVRCDHCGRRFAERDLLALHRGFEHPDRLTERERDAFEAAYDAEDEDLRLFRLKALLGLVSLYFLLLFAYSIFG